MPNRIIRDSARTSPTLAQLTGDEERFYWRLVTVADDYGRFEAEACVMRALCFPRQVDQITTVDVTAWFVKLADVGLVKPYVIDGRAFGVFVTWEKHQRIRAKESRFPAPIDAIRQAPDTIRAHPLSDDSTCAQTTTNVAVVVVVNEDGNGNEVGTSAPSAPALTDISTSPKARLGPKVEADVVDEDLMNAAWVAFPQHRGDTLRAVVAYVWQQAKGGPPPARKLDALDPIRGRVPIMRVVKGLRRYLAERTDKYGLEDFIAHLNDWAPEKKTRASPVTAIPDEKPARSADEIASVRSIVGALPWARKAEATP